MRLISRRTMRKEWVVLFRRQLPKTLTTTSSSFIIPGPFSSSSSSFAIKNVTKSNFEAAVASLSGHVREADFVAIDVEMTGISSAPWRELLQFDRFDVRYLKVKDSVNNFAVVQFGVCPFRWDHSTNTFLAHPHNFYVFPRQEVPFDGQSNEFMCQTASIDFLAKYQFDFNMCIREGISYLSRRQEEDARRQLTSLYEDETMESQFKVKESTDMPIVRMADVLFTERIKCKISEWRRGLMQVRNVGHEFQKSVDDSVLQFETIFFKMRPAIKLNGFTTRQLRLIQLVAKKHFEDVSYIRVSGENSSLLHLLVYTESTSDRDLLMKEVKACLHSEAEIKIQNAVGFRQVIDLLSSEEKLIVGHNCFLDIAHVYSKFIGPLPSTAEEYVSSISKYFPYLIDTKILLNASNIFQVMKKKSITSLANAFSFLCPQIASGVKSSHLAYKSCVDVEVQVDEMRSSNWNSGAKHEAGYDAFMTGCVFAQACSHLGIDFKTRALTTNLALEDKLKEHLNLLYLSWKSGDIIDLRTGNQTLETAGSNVKIRHPKILFSNIVLLWGFPSKLKSTEIRRCITQVFGPTSVTSTYQVDETALFIQFNKPELVSDFLELKATLETNNDPISVLHPLSKILDGGCTCAASYEIYKEICESSISKVSFADQAAAIGITWKTKLLEPNLEDEMHEDETLGKIHGQHRTPSSLGKDEGEKIVSVIRDFQAMACSST